MKACQRPASRGGAVVPDSLLRVFREQISGAVGGVASAGWFWGSVWGLLLLDPYGSFLS